MLTKFFGNYTILGILSFFMFYNKKMNTTYKTTSSVS